MNFGQCVSYLMGTISKIPYMLSGFTFYTNGGLKASSGLLKNSSPRLDLSNGANQLYDTWGSIFWVTFFVAVVNTVLGFFAKSSTILSVIGGILGIVFSLIGYAVVFCIVCAFVYLSEKANKKWVNAVVQIFVIAIYIAMIGNVISTLVSLFRALRDIFRYFRIIPFLRSLLTVGCGVYSLACEGVILGGLLRGVPCDNPINTNNYNSGYGFNGNQGYNPSGNVNYNQGNSNVNPMAGAAGLAGLGAVNSQRDATVGVQTENINLNKPNENISQSEAQLYSCPYCQGVLHQNESPCPHCGNMLNW